MTPKKTLDLDLALEEVARKVRPAASVYTVNPSNCATENCSPQCECCSVDVTCWTSPCPDPVICPPTSPGAGC